MKIAQHTLHWGRPELLVPMSIIIGIALLILIYRLYKVRRVVDLLTVPERRSTQLAHYSFSRRVLKVVCMTIGLIGLMVTYMRPQWQEEQETIAKQGRDVIIALDISRSMLATDMPPDRLQFAKQKIKQLITALKTERVGLMLFSGAAFMQCPLTEDQSAFSLFLDQVDVETISSGTTATQEAIAEAIRVFRAMPERKSRLLVLFTDGEDFSSNLMSLKQEAATIGLHIITVGVGTMEGAPIPLYNKRGQQEGHQVDVDGNVVITRLNEGILHRLAQDTGGIYVPVSTRNDDVRTIVSFVQGFEKEQLDDVSVKHFKEFYHYPLLVSFICFVIEWLL